MYVALFGRVWSLLVVCFLHGLYQDPYRLSQDPNQDPNQEPKATLTG